MAPSSSKTLVLRGSLIVLKRRCGKPSCRCNREAVHETPALSYSVGGTTGILTLHEQDVREVRAALARYKRALSQLEKQARAGITSLRRRLEAERVQRKGRGRS
jgi:hypothetical protein